MPDTTAPPKAVVWTLQSPVEPKTDEIFILMGKVATCTGLTVSVDSPALHPQFLCQGNDLVLTVRISVFFAAPSFVITVSAPGTESVSLIVKVSQ